MFSLTEKILNDVCLDERIPDGIFRLENNEHMNALRDYFIKKGITNEDAIRFTNRMLEGKYPERQAYRKEDGILVTWPSPQHMQKALADPKNAGKYVKEDPFPERRTPKSDEAPAKDKKPLPDKAETEEVPDEKEIEKEPTIFQGGQKLDIEPPGGESPEKNISPDISVKPSQPEPILSAPPQEPPKTPERVAAEKEIVKQIFNTDDTTLTDVSPPINEEDTCKYQLRELYKKADELGFREAVKFLTPYIIP